MGRKNKFYIEETSWKAKNTVMDMKKESIKSMKATGKITKNMDGEIN